MNSRPMPDEMPAREQCLPIAVGVALLAIALPVRLAWLRIAAIATYLMRARPLFHRLGGGRPT